MSPSPTLAPTPVEDKVKVAGEKLVNVDGAIARVGTKWDGTVQLQVVAGKPAAVGTATLVTGSTANAYLMCFPGAGGLVCVETTSDKQYLGDVWVARVPLPAP